MKNNVFTKNGLMIWGQKLKYWNTHTIDNTNLLNGKPIYYGVNLTGGISPTNPGQIIVVNCTQITITDHTITNSSIGIIIGYSNNCSLIKNDCSWNSYCGIHIYECENIIASENTLFKNGKYGLLLVESNIGSFVDNIIETTNGSGFVLSESSNFSIDNITLHHNAEDGLLLSDSHYCYIANNSITDNKIGIEFVDSSSNNSVRDNTIAGNTDYGISAIDNGQVNVDAKNNYWGHASGPYHPTKNPNGEGDNVSDYVDFEPWTDVQPVEESSLRITIIKPSEGDTVNGTIEISGEVSPLSSEADSQILIKIDDGSWDEATSKAYYLNTCFWQIEWISQSVENGQHTIFVKAYDGENWSDIAQINITTENQEIAYLIQIPQWEVGDKWTWSYLVEVEGQSSTMTVTEEIIAINVEETDNDTALDEPCYKLVAKTLIMGQTISTSTAFLSMETLELLAEDFQGEGMPLFLYGFMAELDWPLIITDGGPYQWSDAGNITVEAGTYPCYKLEGSSGPLYYSPEVEHIIKADMGEINFELKKGGTDGDSESDEDDELFLYEQIGPLPLIGYIGIVTGIAIISIAGVKKKKSSKLPETKSSQQSPQISQVPQQYQQQAQTQFPQQAPQQQYTQPQMPQQYQQPQQQQYQQQYAQGHYQQPSQTPQQYQQASQQVPAQQQAPTQPTTWSCPTCGNRSEQQFLFCIKCGFKRGN